MDGKTIGELLTALGDDFVSLSIVPTTGGYMVLGKNVTIRTGFGPTPQAALLDRYLALHV